MGRELKLILREKILEKLTYQKQMEDEELTELIDEEIYELPESERLTVDQRIRLHRELFDSFRRLDILQELVDDDEITEIMVNGPNHIFIEKHGQILRWNKTFESKDQLLDLIRQIVSGVNRTVNTSSPIADARLPDSGSRVHIVLEPVAIDGPVLTIRKFPEPITMDRLISCHSISEEAASLLKILVKARYNIFVSGGTGAGKTTFLNALSEFIPKDERVITIEDSAELKLLNCENLVRLETRNANAEGSGAIGIGDLIRASLRMRPDRILIGEVRGKEAVDLLQAMNTGHDGSLSTGHANSARDMLSRLETMVLMSSADLPLPAIRRQIASAIDILVHVSRMRDKSRRVVRIEEVDGYENGEIRLHTLYEFREERSGEGEKDGKKQVEGRLWKTGELRHREKLGLSGIEL